MKKVTFLFVLFCAACGAFCDDAAKYVELINFKASSTLGEKYLPQNICDGNWTSWVEGASGSGEGEWIEAEFSEKTPVTHISIKNGFGNLSYFWTNNRVKDCDLIFDDDFKHSVSLVLDDTPEVQVIYLGQNSKAYKKMRLVIKSVYKGTDTDNDTCIAELAVNARFSQPALAYYGYYDGKILPYNYDPETARLKLELFKMDVGEKYCGLTKDGQVYVQAKDWEDGGRYTVQDSGSLGGILYNDYWPGTGGGHEISRYSIFLRPDGSHIFFKTFDYGDGGAAGNKLTSLYVWKNKTWNSVFDKKNRSICNGLEEIFKLTDEFDQKGIKYDFYPHQKTNSVTIIPRIVESYSGNYCRFNFCMNAEKTAFKPYEVTEETCIVNGKSTDLASGLLFTEGWKDRLDERLAKLNLLCIASAFNRDPDVIQKLIDMGYAVNGKYMEDYGTDFTPLEVCLKFKNSDAVKKVLLKNGAEYSHEILIDALHSGNYDNFIAECANFNDKSFLVPELGYAYRDLIDKNNNALKYIQKVLKYLMSQNVDFNCDYKYRNKNYNFPVECVNEGPEFLKMALDSGIKYDGKLLVRILKECYDSSIIPAVDVFNSYGCFKNFTAEEKAAVMWKLYRSCSIELMEKLNENISFDFNAPEPEEENLLVFKSFNDSKGFDYFWYFYNKGMNLDAVNKNGETFAHKAFTYVYSSDGEKELYRPKDAVKILSILKEKNIKMSEEEQYNVLINMLDQTLAGSPYFAERFENYKEFLPCFNAKKLSNGNVYAGGYFLEKYSENIKRWRKNSLEDHDCRVNYSNTEKNFALLITELKKLNLNSDFKVKALKKAGFSDEFAEQYGC